MVVSEEILLALIDSDLADAAYKLRSARERIQSLRARRQPLLEARVAQFALSLYDSTIKLREDIATKKGRR